MADGRWQMAVSNTTWCVYIVYYIYNNPRGAAIVFNESDVHAFAALGGSGWFAATPPSGLTDRAAALRTALCTARPLPASLPYGAALASTASLQLVPSDHSDSPPLSLTTKSQSSCNVAVDALWWFPDDHVDFLSEPYTTKFPSDFCNVR
jgi:hypothetical protein